MTNLRQFQIQTSQNFEVGQCPMDTYRLSTSLQLCFLLREGDITAAAHVCREVEVFRVFPHMSPPQPGVAEPLEDQDSNDAAKEGES